MQNDLAIDIIILNAKTLRSRSRKALKKRGKRK